MSGIKLIKELEPDAPPGGVPNAYAKVNMLNLLKRFDRARGHKISASKDAQYISYSSNRCRLL